MGQKSSGLAAVQCGCTKNCTPFAQPKKKKLVGDFKNAGREWPPDGRARRVRMHDFPGDAVGKARQGAAQGESQESLDFAHRDARLGNVQQGPTKGG